MDINGIEVIELRSMIERVEKDPALGHYTFRGMTTWRGGGRSSTDIRGFTIEGNEPAGLTWIKSRIECGGTGACSIGDMSYGGCHICRGSAGDYDSIDVFYDRRGTGYPSFFGMKGIHPGYEHIGVMVHLQADAKREELEPLLTPVIKTSPVRDIIARNVPVNIQLAKEE